MTIDSKLRERDKINSFLARFGLKTDWKLQKPAGDQSWFSSLVFITSPQCQIITVFFMKVQNGMTGNATVVSLDDKVDLCFKLNWSLGNSKISLYAGHKWMFSRSISPHTCRCSGNEAAIYWWMIYWGMTRNWRTCRPHIFHHSVSSGIKLAPQEKERKSVMLQPRFYPQPLNISPKTLAAITNEVCRLMANNTVLCVQEKCTKWKTWPSRFAVTLVERRLKNRCFLTRLLH